MLDSSRIRCERELAKIFNKINSINDTQILLFFCGFFVVTSHWLAGISTSLIFLFLCLVRVGFGANESLQKYYFFGFLVENLNKRTVFRLDKDFANVETKFMQYLVNSFVIRRMSDTACLCLTDKWTGLIPENKQGKSFFKSNLKPFRMTTTKFLYFTRMFNSDRFEFIVKSKLLLVHVHKLCGVVT